ncbi:NuoI/complex I 23 kDa subunit family protein [Nonomuraea maritima]|uniref:NuoI/complex I 23 kDa subunit family protein n=1 Tax=Nonomuraea maritima TaxID=683260 RepID=UPI00370FACC9
MLSKSVTQQYPEVKPDLPPRSRGVIALVEENCTSCMLCARECPDWCIYIDSHKETIPAPEGGRPRQRNVLDRFAIDFSLCMYCGICIEVCPFDALFWSPEFEYAEGDIRNLLHEKDRLAAWTATVPPPPPHDPGADVPKELTAARRPTSGPSARAARPTTPTTRTSAPTDRTPASTDRAPGPADGTPGPTDRTRTDHRTRAPQAGGTTHPEGTAPSEGTAQREGAASRERPMPSERTASPRDAGSPEGAAPSDGTPSRGAAPSDSTAPESRRPAPSTPPAGEEAPARARTRRPMANIRAIRPPGALPQPTEPSTGTGTTPEPPSPDTGSAGPGPVASGEHPPPDAARDAGSGTDDAPESGVGGETSEQGTRQRSSSTGQPSPEELSTGSGEPPPGARPEGQTSAASPRRRKMADPRSIRPPGRLDPDETRESEEES